MRAVPALQNRKDFRMVEKSGLELFGAHSVQLSHL